MDPNVGHPTPFVFPAVIPLPGWQPLASHPIADIALTPPEADGNYRVARHYRYIAHSETLDIEARYVVGTDGDVTSRKFDQVIHQYPGVGFYAIFTAHNKAYLSSCINPRGGTRDNSF